MTSLDFQLLLIPTSAMPPEAQSFLVAVMIVGVCWWIGHRLWVDIAARPAERRPNLVNWYKCRGRSSQSSIKMGWAVALAGLAILALKGRTFDASPNTILGFALVAIGFAQVLYGSLVLR